MGKAQLVQKLQQDRARLRTKHDELYSAAQELFTDFRDQRTTTARRTRDEVGPMLFLRERRRTPRSVIELWWEVGQRDSRYSSNNMKTQHLPKNKSGFAYSFHKLRRFATDREWPLIEETERQARAIREASHALKGADAKLEIAIKALET